MEWPEAVVLSRSPWLVTMVDTAVPNRSQLVFTLLHSTASSQLMGSLLNQQQLPAHHQTLGCRPTGTASPKQSFSTWSSFHRFFSTSLFMFPLWPLGMLGLSYVPTSFSLPTDSSSSKSLKTDCFPDPHWHPSLVQAKYWSPALCTLVLQFSPSRPSFSQLLSCSVKILFLE